MFPIALKHHIPRRGRGLVTTRDVAAGEIVLAEEPLLLTVSQEFKDAVCTNCLCWLEHCPGAVRCQQCCQAAFCTPACQQQAAERPWVHAAATCSAYKALPQLLPGDAEQQNCLRFLIQAAAIKATAAAAAVGGGCGSGSGAGGSSSSTAQRCAAAYQVLLSLVGEATPATAAAAAVLHPALCKAIGDASGQLLTAAEVAALLSKEQLNCFGLLAPLHLQQQQQPSPHASASAAAAAEQEEEEQEEEEEAAGRASRRLRGGALYPVCALLNHECLPNVARFDALDGHCLGGSWPAQWPGRQQHLQQQQQQQQQQDKQQQHANLQQQQLATAVAAVVGGDAAAVATVAAASGLSAAAAPASSSSSSTLVTMRALHALPAGTEVVISYVPLNWDLADRQQQTQQVYGFECGCPRCLLESSPEWQQQAGSDAGGSSGEWETDDDSSDDDEGGAQEGVEEERVGSGRVAAAGESVAMMEEEDGKQQLQQQEALEPGYLSVFLLKFMCPRPRCYGTMAAVQGSAAQLCECSVCGATRNEAQFLAELNNN